MTNKTTVLNEEALSKYPQKPHGGKLVDREATGEEREKGLEKAKSLSKIMIDLEAVITLEMIATGVLSPNDGFMNEEDYLSVLATGRLKNGIVWPPPLSFAPIGDRTEQVAASHSVGDEVLLVDHEELPSALLKVEDLFDYARDHRAEYLFG